jgi:hypothetical protein
VTPFEWTRGRLRVTVASLLVNFSGQILKWQEPASAAAETVHRFLRLFRRPHKVFSSLRNTPKLSLANQHAVSVTIEAVACLYSVIVGREYVFAAREGAHKREQSRARQVKIREQGIDYPEMKSRIDE